MARFFPFFPRLTGGIVHNRPFWSSFCNRMRTMLDVSGRFRASEPEQKWLREFHELDEKGDSGKLVYLSLSRIGELPLELQLLVVFHAWKSGKLDLTRLSLQNSAQGLHSSVDQFLTCHELLVSGRKHESMEVLKELARECDSEIVQYRFIGDYLEHGSLKNYFKLAGDLIPELPTWRAATVRFNYGIAALNQSLYTVVDDVLVEMSGYEDIHHRFFHGWLLGQYLMERGDHRLAMNSLREALSLGETIPCRATEVATVAANLLTAGFWSGDVSTCVRAHTFIERAAKEKKCVLGEERRFALRAMVELMTGHVGNAEAAFNSMYSKPNFSRDHLITSFPALWIMLLQKNRAEINEIIAKLEETRDRLDQSREFFDYELFRMASSLKEGTESFDDFAAKASRFVVRKSHSPHTFHLKWAQALVGYFQEPSFESLHLIMEDLRDYPILERLMLATLSPRLCHNVGLLRFCGERIGDKVTQALASLQLGRLTNDPARVAKALVSLKKNDAVTWLNVFGEKNSYAKALRESAAIVSVSSEKVASLETCETLDGQIQLNKLFVTFAEQQFVDKEALILGLGWPEYNPGQHDPIIHNLISRLRQWIGKNVSGLEITRSPKGWGFNNRDLIYALDRQAIPEVSPAPQVAPQVADHVAPQSAPAAVMRPAQISKAASESEMHPRLEWIIEQLKIRKSITRTDVLNHFGIRKSAAVNDFNILLEKGLIRRCGAGRGVYYRLQGDNK